MFSHYTLEYNIASTMFGRFLTNYSITHFVKQISFLFLKRFCIVNYIL